jgi:hypothetical protein
MPEKRIGYGNPPEHTRFKSGTSGNPRGRPKRKVPVAGEIINSVLNAPAEYRERGQTKTAARRELTLRNYVMRALGGDVRAAEVLLKLRAHAQRFSDTGVHSFEVTDWLPDHPGQTAAEKTHEVAVQGEVPAPEWWKDAPSTPSSEDP